MAKKLENNFEKSLQDLEKIVESLEEGDLSLESTVAKFEEGVQLFKECKEFLGKAEKRVRVLTEKLKEEEFED